MNKNAEIWFFRTGAALFLIYLLLRAWRVPITIDEVSTCYNHVPRRVVDMLTYQTEATPNNHVLNTLLIKIFSGMFGLEYIIVRIPALAGGALYCWAAWAIAKRLERPWLRMFAFGLLLANPFVAEFFALARGYGLSVGLMLMAIWQMLVWRDSRRREALVWTMVLAALGVEANFTLLNFFAPFLCFVALQLFANRDQPLWPSVKPVLWATGILALLCYAPIAAMRKTNQFQYWGNKGFITETLVPLVNSSTWDRPQDHVAPGNILSWLIILVSVGCWVLAVVRYWRNKRVLTDDLLLSGLFAGTVLVNLLQFALFGTPFLNARTALFFYPLFALQLVALAGWLWERWGRKTFYYAIPLSAFAAINLLFCVNINHAREWWADSATFEVLDYVKQTYISEGRKAPISFDTSWEMMNSVMFHVEHNRSRWAVVAGIPPWHDRRTYAADTEFYYAVSDGDAKPFLDAYDIVFRATHGPMVLIRRKADHPLPAK